MSLDPIRQQRLIDALQVAILHANKLASTAAEQRTHAAAVVGALERAIADVQIDSDPRRI